MKKNLCEKCNECCITLRIHKKYLSWRDTHKESGEICDKLVNGRCIRYSNRPKLCKNFRCLWLTLGNDERNRPEWRPDKVGFIVRLVTEGDQQLIIIKELVKNSLDLNNRTGAQDSFLKEIFKIKKDASMWGNHKSIVLIQPFGHKHQYPLLYTPD